MSQETCLELPLGLTICVGNMSYVEFFDAISAFFAHPFVLMVGSVLLAWWLKRGEAKEK